MDGKWEMSEILYRVLTMVLCVLLILLFVGMMFRSTQRSLFYALSLAVGFLLNVLVGAHCILRGRKVGWLCVIACFILGYLLLNRLFGFTIEMW